MQLAVSDSDVIIHLAKLNELRLIEEAIRLGILTVHETSESKAKGLAKRYGIHIGEGHVKELAEKLDASIFLSNEKKVRIAAKMEGFPVAGSIGIILRSMNLKYLTAEEAAGLLEKLRGDEFRIHPDIINKAMDSCKRLRSSTKSQL